MLTKIESYGKEVKLYFRLKKYAEGDREAIQAYEFTDDGESQPYAMITVNFPNYPLPEPKIHGFYCFIDTNNCPWAYQMLLDTGIGIPTGDFRTSYFCSYPVFFIFTANLKKYRGV